ncbi:MAG: hypothetical protein A2Y88_11000 [Chloroflexi bacterium RBG_13_48_10]|nr:MAG: hypothetical protein A2Y88_11000 [Chloroflexi bacterium RBG_13_48_10]
MEWVKFNTLFFEQWKITLHFFLAAKNFYDNTISNLNNLIYFTKSYLILQIGSYSAMGAGVVVIFSAELGGDNCHCTPNIYVNRAHACYYEQNVVNLINICIIFCKYCGF